MFLLRWIPTFLAFPLAGFVAGTLFGSMSNPLVALAGGLVVGLSLGAAQWLALGRIVDWRWLVGTALASAAGLAVAVLLAGPPTETGSAVVAGAVGGLFVGSVQGMLLGRGIRIAALWAVVVAGTWALGWFLTSLVIVDLDRAHAVFGSSGAIVVTLVTGLVLRVVLGRRAARRSAEGADEGDIVVESHA
ncbi:hypothetical protein [Microbacterium ulmi]|uniref:Uncharacterized protein n=1 Tax=Microbacterium ulmi TaxID=179095 RepID=A0A7Y2PYV8_9MICO|nr:hypothetical protein [Microbacterium ulmi]NII71359.1 hypothetical protein [Microbacterium ulmi]NNH02663.1 hypothetical protein [Microbacterium ulmi]